MLKLYFAQGACSLSPHIALREAGLPFTLERVDLRGDKRLADGRSFLEINPKGYVPALELGDGRVLTEGVAIVQYIADLKPEAHLAPPPGSFERAQLQEWLNFIATELHKGIGPLFSNLASEEFKTATKEKVGARVAFLATSLGKKPFLLGETFSVADGYALYALRGWKRFAPAALPEPLVAYYARIEARPAVQAALAAEQPAAAATT